MMKFKTLLAKYKATIAYVVTVVVVNMLYSVLPFIILFGKMLSPADAIVGAIYIVRDFAQREIGHRVILAMVVGAILSFLLASNEVALASVAAFVVGETIDWLIFTYTQKPLSERLLYSAMISAPIDTYVFLYVMGNLNWVEFSAMTLAKFVGVLGLWFLWRRKSLLSSRFIVIPGSEAM